MKVNGTEIDVLRREVATKGYRPSTATILSLIDLLVVASDEVDRLRPLACDCLETIHPDGSSEMRCGSKQMMRQTKGIKRLSAKLQQIGDLAASCRTGPALREALATIECIIET